MVGVSVENAGQLAARRCQHAGDLGRGRLDQADDLAAQLVERRQRGERLHALLVEQLVAEQAAENDELFLFLGVRDGDLGGRDRVRGIGDGRGAREQVSAADALGVPSIASFTSRFFTTLSAPPSLRRRERSTVNSATVSPA